MSRVVVVDVPEPLVTRLEEAAGVRVDAVAGDRLEAALDTPSLVVVASAAHGVELAQRVHRAAPGAAVVLLTSSEEEQATLTAALMVTPGIGRHTRCVESADAAALDAIVDEVGWSKQRASHHETLSKIRGSLTHLTAAAPEAMSRYLGQLFDHAPIGILIADPAGVIRAANPRTGSVTGRQPRDATGTTFASFFAGATASLARDLIVDCVSSGAAVVETLTRTGPDGTNQHLEVTVAAVDPQVESLGVIILLHDESARIHALEATEHARRMAEEAADRYAELSRTLQQSLLPPALPEIEGFDLAARYHAAGDGTLVGGDFYDMLCLPDGRWCVVLGDVSGKGVDAATLTSLARYSLRTAALSTSTVGELFATLNAVLGDYAQGERFCTLAAIVVEPGGTIEVALAGHPAPIVVRRNGELEAVGVPAPPVGLFDELEVASVTTHLGAGDSLVVTSDGVTEARTPAGEFVPDLLDRVLPTVAGGGATAIADAVDAAVLAVERARTRDDVAIVVLSATKKAR